ncbi:MAG: redoxin family protein [bacterium]|nr:redoxin family protein [bacterium]
MITRNRVVHGIAVLMFVAVASFVSAEIKPIEVTSLDGKRLTVGRGGELPELVMVLATRCPVSNAYNSRMAAIAKEYEGKVKVVGVNPNETEDNAEVIRHAKENGLNFPVYRDPGLKLTEMWKLRVTPEVFLFDKAGKLYYSGRIDDSQEESKIKSQDLRNALDRLLSGKAAIVSETKPFGCSIKRMK